jgi:putative DNA primase/helicase
MKEWRTDELSLICRCASEINPERVEWIWPGRIAIGKHTCIAGEPGTGKSQLATAIEATITMGGEWPCGEGKAPQGSILILSAEDGEADTIVPRLHAAEADLGRVHIISAVRTDDDGRRSFNLQADLELLERKITQIGDVALVRVDPISSYLGKTDSHKNAEVRGVLEPLSEMAERMRVAVLSVTHFSKAGATNTTKALHRFIGSIAFVGAPRMAFAVIEDAGDKDRRLLLHAKNNLAAPPLGLAFKLKQTIVGEPGKGIVASRVDWEQEHVSITADAALAAGSDIGEKHGSALGEAEEFLRNVLGQGAQCAKDVQRQAEEAGIASKTLRRAREKLGVKIRTDGFQGPSVWELSPQCCPSNPNDAHQSNVGNIGPDGQDWTRSEADPAVIPFPDLPPSCGGGAHERRRSAGVT